jgi:hypothetical protein
LTNPLDHINIIITALGAVMTVINLRLGDLPALENVLKRIESEYPDFTFQIFFNSPFAILPSEFDPTISDHPPPETMLTLESDHPHSEGIMLYLLMCIEKG